jgi:hypothetical protein
MLSAAVKRFCVDHFLFNGSLTHSLSPPFTLTYYQSINARTAHMTRGGRKFVVKSFVRPSVRSSIHSLLSVLCNSPAAHVCVCIRVYMHSLHLLSPSPVCVCVCILTLVAERLLRGQFCSRTFSLRPLSIMVLCKDQNSYIRIRPTDRRASHGC